MEYLIKNKVQYKIFDRDFKASSHIYSYNLDISDYEVTNNRDVIKSNCGAKKLYTLNQKHESNIIIIDEKSDENIEQEGDAIITNLDQVSIAVKTADCVPVLLSSACGRVIAAIHCSWRCTKAGIISKTIEKMAQIENFAGINAVIGPSIKQHSYEVDQNFYDDFIIEDELNNDLFIKTLSNKYLFDLTGYVIKKLENLSVSITYVSNDDTYSNPAKYPSYRFSLKKGEKYHGSILSLIMKSA